MISLNRELKITKVLNKKKNHRRQIVGNLLVLPSLIRFIDDGLIELDRNGFPSAILTNAKKNGMRYREQKNCELFEHTINGEKEKNILYIYQTDRATFN